MKTTRLIFTGLCLVLSLHTFAAGSVPQKTFIYRVMIEKVTDKTSFGHINKELESIFDNSIKFNDTTDEIVVHSDWDLSREKLSTALNRIGYSLSRYSQASYSRATE